MNLLGFTAILAFGMGMSIGITGGAARNGGCAELRYGRRRRDRLSRF
jgi:hypothetical protein